MKRIFLCRRSSLALIGIAALTWIALKNGTDVSLSIAGIVGAIGASNAWQARGDKHE